MTKNDRLRALIRYMIKELHLADNQAQLGDVMGYANASYFSQIINGKVAIPREFNSKIKDLVPDVSLEWIESGFGDMLLTRTGNVTQHDQSQFAQGNINNNTLSDAMEIIKKQQEQIDELINLLKKQNNE